MNQDILFPDLQEWHGSSQLVSFPAQQCGALIQCYISKSQLEHMTGLPLLAEADVMRAFDSLRFDIEEMASEAIEEQNFAADGGIYIGQHSAHYRGTP